MINATLKSLWIWLHILKKVALTEMQRLCFLIIKEHIKENCCKDGEMYVQFNAVPVNSMKILGSGGRVPLIRNLDIGRRWVVSFTLRPPKPLEKASFSNWLGGWVGIRLCLRIWKERNIFYPLPRVEEWFLICSAHSLITTPTELSLWIVDITLNDGFYNVPF
jgi:hypothetical protein